MALTHIKKAVYAALALALTLTGVTTTAVTAGATNGAPHFRVPFACGQTWVGETRRDHSPSEYAIDFNHYAPDGSRDDLGRRVTASAGGTVVKVVTGLEASYGNHVIIRHADGWSTLYAHLMDDSIRVTTGQTVSKGQVIAKVGASGLSSVNSAHLHYEQRYNGNDVRAVFYGDQPALYFGSRNYKTPSC